MTNPDYKALCAELTEALDAELDLFETRHSALLDRARAALAQPELVAPTDEEIEQWKFSSFLPSLSQSNQLAYPITDKDLRIIARAVLAKWGRQ